MRPSTRMDSRKLRARSVWLAALLFFAGCVSAKPYNPYEVPREEFARLVRTIGIMPPGVYLRRPHRERVAADIERAVTEILQARGYRVVGSDVVGPVWRRYASQIGGVFDPLTGEPDDEKLRVARSYAARDLAHSHQVDALLLAFTSERTLYRSNGEPVWPQFNGENIRLDQQPVLDMPQLVTGVWLSVIMVEPDGRRLYKGGIPVQWRTVYVARSYFRRPDEELFPSDRVSNAVRELLAPLERCVAPAPTTAANP